MQIDLTITAKLKLSIQPSSNDDLPDNLMELRVLLCSLHGPTSAETLALIEKVTAKIRRLEKSK